MPFKKSSLPVKRNSTNLVLVAVGRSRQGEDLAVEGATQLVVDAHVPGRVVGGKSGSLKGIFGGYIGKQEASSISLALVARGCKASRCTATLLDYRLWKMFLAAA